MMLSPHNFFFVSFDPGGFVSVDKPPVALWIQTLFALAFGFHGWSILLPEALAAVFSVLLIYHLVHRTFGFGAGIVAALALALSPIFIAVSSTNNLDSILVLDLLLSAWALLKATERGNIKILLLAMLLAGIGFNIKMLEAYLVLPTFFLTYFICKTVGLKRKMIHIAAAAAVLLVVSFSWAIAVDSTPAADRPYVGSSKTNSVMELAFGYNGINRILSGLKWPESLAAKLSGHPLKIKQQEIKTALGIPKAVLLPTAGAPGIFRLFNKSLGGQIGWFLLIALLGLPAFVIESVKSGATVVRNKMAGAIFWSSWVLIMNRKLSEVRRRKSGQSQKIDRLTLDNFIARNCGRFSLRYGESNFSFPL
jgi:4-amino-4-deoxy-L-arabinose transferase-like glycosyltransferase